MEIAGITFEPIGHVYRFNGIRIPSVTQVIDGQLRDFSKVPNIVLEQARELGTLVHTATALDAAGVLDEASVDDDVWPYVCAWRKFIAEKQPEIWSTEEMVYHKQYGFCGTLDHRLQLDGVHTLIDKKSGIADDADEVQTAAYTEAWHSMRPGLLSPARIRRRAALYLGSNGQYRIKYHDRKGDFQDFLGALTVFKRNHRNG